jgi:hypothetical protein|eukprot:COSAG06_NODE_9737_length_1829_cov_1.556069_3_plen_47_part_00
MAGYTRLLELVEERELTDFKGLPNIYAGCARRRGISNTCQLRRLYK